MKLAFGTVVRNAPVGRGGELAVYDWDSGRVEHQVLIVPTDPSLADDPNPRGNARGCRGVTVFDGHVVAANYHTLVFFTRDLRQVRTMSHGLMAGLHEVWAPGDGTIWVASTSIDAALRYDFKSAKLLESRWPREHPALQAELGFEPLALDKTADNRKIFLGLRPSDLGSHLHLNAVVGWEGRLIALLNTQGCIVDLDAGTILMEDANLRHAHNLVPLPDGTVLVNDTIRKMVRCYDLHNGREVRALDLLGFPVVGRHWRLGRRQGLARAALRKLLPGVAKAPSMPLMVRGLAHHDGELFVGVSPAAVLRIDWESGELLGFRTFSRRLDVCVHGLAVMSG
ncbi:MAG: hypothetical protein ACT4P5_00875 [Armatimonadota bacterium]